MGIEMEFGNSTKGSLKHLVVLVLLLGSFQAQASVKPGPNCVAVQKQLQEMERAQGLLLQSMVKKNDSLAGTLDHFADDLKSHQQKPSPSDVVNLKKTAEAFRGHGDRELVLINKFQKKSLELVNQALICLSQNEPKKSHRNQNLRTSSAQVSQLR